MKIFAALFPIVILIVGMLAYFIFVGRGAYFLPDEKMVIPDKIIKDQLQVASSAGSKKITLTLEDIFKANLATPSGETVTLIATGDVIPARSVNFQVVTRKDFLWPYRFTSQLVKSADITFVNLETPLLQKCPLTQEGMIFCGDYRNIEGLVSSGVDIVSLANNHAGNHGLRGVNETIEHLTKAGLKHTGIKGAEYVKVKNTVFAFLGYSDIEKNNIVSSADEDRIIKEVSEARKKANLVIVTYHWGTEYKSQPDQRQIDLGHLTIDAGADLVIGNHPHWIQPVEFYKDKLITYAHGNYIFDQEWSQKTKEGVIGRYTFSNEQLVKVEYFPLQINDYGQAKFLEGEQKVKILDEMYQESLKLRN